MTPKEKAKELVEDSSKKRALIAVAEVIKSNGLHLEVKKYWQEVKQEIEKL